MDSDIQKAVKLFFTDINEFYYKELEPITSFLRSNGIHTSSMHGNDEPFQPDNLAALVIGLEEQIKQLNDAIFFLKKKTDSVKSINTLKDYATSLTTPIFIPNDVMIKYEYDEGIKLEENEVLDSISKYFRFIKRIKKDWPADYSYQTALIDSIVKYMKEEKKSFFFIAQKFRKYDIGTLFIEYSLLLKKHLSPGTELGKYISNMSTLKERKIPTLKEVFKNNTNKIKLSKGKGYKNIVNLVRKESNWESKDFINQLYSAYANYEKENSNIEKYNTLLVFWHWDAVFSYHPIKQIRFSGIRGYSQQKKDFKTQIERFSNGKLINHIAVIGPPGTGKTSLVLAATNSYKNVKFLFLDELLSRQDMENLPKILNELTDYNKKFFVYADDTKYEDATKIWDQIRSIIEGTKDFSPNIRLLLSTNNWDNFPLSFQTRFGTQIKMNYPDTRIQKSIAAYHKQKYNVGENIPQILEEARKDTDNISGRTIEKVCVEWGLYEIGTLEKDKKF